MVAGDGERSESLEPVVADDRHPHVRLLRHGRIRRDLGTGMGERVEQRRLPCIGEADDPDLKRQRERLGLEADARFASESLRVQNPREHEQDVPVLRLETERSERSGGQGRLERVRALRGDEDAQDLSAVEPDLDPNEAVVNH